MSKLTKEQLRNIILMFIPKDIGDNIFIRSLLAGATAVGILIATPAFAPVGVVGATGWIIVYIVSGGTLGVSLLTEIWVIWKKISVQKREEIDIKLLNLKKLKDDGAISLKEYKEDTKKLLDELLKRKKTNKTDRHVAILLIPDIEKMKREQIHKELCKRNITISIKTINKDLKELGIR